MLSKQPLKMYNENVFVSGQQYAYYHDEDEASFQVKNNKQKLV